MGGNPQASRRLAARVPRRARRARRHPRARRQGRRHRPAPHRHRRPRRRVGADPARAPTPRSCSRCATCSSPRASSTSARSTRRSRASTTVRERVPRSSRPSRSRRSAGSRPTRIRRLAREFAAAPSGRASTAASGCATRSSARSRRGWSTSSTSSPATSTVPAGSCSASRSRGRWRGWRRPRKDGRARLRPLDSRACRGAPEVLGPGARCRAWPRRSPRRATGQIKALFTDRRQPGDQRARRRPRLDAALPELDCMISVDNYLNETTRHAHVILPGPSPLEQPHFDDLHLGLGRRAAARNWSDPVFPPPADRPDEWEILTRLGWLCTGGHERATSTSTTLDDGWFAALCRVAAARRRRHRSRTTTAAARSGSRPAGPHRPVGRPLRRGARRAHARADQGRSRTASTSARWSRASTRSCARPTGTIDLAPDVHHRRPAPPRARASTATDDDGFRARQPPPPALEQLVDAQREGAREGQGPLHAARAPRRRRAASGLVDGGSARVTLGGRHASRCRSR